jgi:hypothetical protein
MKPAQPPAEWGLARRILFRFTLVYVILYTVPILLSYAGHFAMLYEQPWTWILENLFVPYARVLDWVVGWVAENVFHIEITTPLVSVINGDTPAVCIQLLCYAALAALAAAGWSLVDRRRDGHPRLGELFRVYARFALAVPILLYGSFKLIMSQYSDPSLDQLTTPLGDYPAGHLMFTFHSASVPYTMFAGAVEVIAGLLLTFRRTTLLGALMCTGAMTQVVMLNVCYDVFVKLFSTHLLLLSVVVAAPDLRRLFHFLVLNRHVPAADIRSIFRRQSLRWAALILRMVLVLGLFGLMMYESYHMATIQGYLRPKPPLYGIWNVQEIVVDGQVQPPIASDTKSWRRIIIEYPDMFVIQQWDDSRQFYPGELNVEQRTIVMAKMDNPRWAATFTYTEPEPGLLVLQGTMDGKQVRITLRRQDETQFRLNGEFHWIRQLPRQG